jgi:flavin reductase (DIM6/NTAB) family NADH-FMN oxidoreductase RutF
LRVEQTHCLGSHTFFIARILHRHVYQNSPEFHRIHGIYAVYRRKSVVGRVPNFWPQ